MVPNLAENAPSSEQYDTGVRKSLASNNPGKKNYLLLDQKLPIKRPILPINGSFLNEKHRKTVENYEKQSFFH